MELAVGRFAQGVKAENPEVKITYAVIGPAAYSDAAGGKRVTESVIAAGADIIFGQGNGSSFGMLQAVETAKAADGGKVLFIDVIGDKTSVDKGFLLSLRGLGHHSGLRGDDQGSEGRYLRHQALRDWPRRRFGEAAEDRRRSRTTFGREIKKLRDEIIAGEIKVEPIYEATAVRALMTDVAQRPSRVLAERPRPSAPMRG